MESSLIGKALDFGSREYGFESHVSNFMVRINAHAHFLNHYKISTSKKSLYFDVRVTSRSYPMLKLFFELNLVRRYAKLGPHFYRVYPNYTHVRRYSRQFDSYLKSNHYLLMSLSVLRVVNRNLPTSYLVLETDRGLLTHKEALKYGVGGRLLLRIH